MKHVAGTPWTLEKIKYFLVEAKSPYSPLFTEYKGQIYYHDWKCSKCKSIFKADWKRLWKTARGLKKGGCMKCANRLNYTIEQVHQELKDSGRPIQCLSKTYENNKKPMMWKCLNEGCTHEWKTSWKAIKGVRSMKPHGCIVCANNVKYTIEKIKEVINQRELSITLLSKRYKSTGSHLKWGCNICDHTWKTSWNAVNNGNTGCPACSNNIPYTIGEVRKILKETNRDIKLLSKKYVSGHSPLEWICLKEDCGNIWKTTWTLINLMGTGCPDCANKSITENRVKNFLNTVFGKKKFNKIRPSWLKNPKTGFNLELDLYCEEMNLAIEVNGPHHYAYNPYWHKSEAHYLDVKDKDEFKKIKLKELGINFIPLSIAYTNLDKIKKDLVTQLEALGYEIPKKFKDLRII